LGLCFFIKRFAEMPPLSMFLRPLWKRGQGSLTLPLLFKVKGTGGKEGAREEGE
jgi:hypothetical protein